MADSGAEKFRVQGQTFATGPYWDDTGTIGTDGPYGRSAVDVAVGRDLTPCGEAWKEATMGEPVRNLTEDELREAQGTPGLTRRTAFEGDGHWFGHVEAAPLAMSGWHHHGDNVTMGYVLKGRITFEFGPDGSQRVEVAEGEYFEVPMNTVHREGNASPEAGEVLITRVGRGPLVFPVEGPDAT